MKDLEWMIEQLQFKMNVDTGQTDQDFIGPSGDTDKWYRSLINEAGEREVVDAKQEGHISWFLMTLDVTWTASSVTYTLPDALYGRNILMMRDVTNDEVGSELPWAGKPHGPGIFYKDNKTLQWDTSGPTQDTTIRMVYELNWQELKADADVPDQNMLPQEFAWLIVWAAVDVAKTIADELVPKDYERHLINWRERYWKHVSRGRPGMDNVARIINNDGDYDVTYY